MKKQVVFLLSILSLLFVSCEIGLGSAVDTMPPELVINQPSAGSVIRDSFTISGTWTDDGTIASVSLTLKDTDSDRKFGAYEAQFETLSNGEGTWQYTIEKDLVPDGTYEVNISIKDNSGHKNENQRQITIDNTAPVLVLQRPFSKLGTNSKVESYGQIFTLEGQAADDSGVGLIEVNVYSDDKLENLVKTLSFDTIPKTISINAAKFAEGQENDYSAIYGSTSRDAGAQIRYCKIIAYDGAVRIPADGSSQSAADLKGNATTGYYIYDDISESLLIDYTVNDLYLMKNGRYTGEQTTRSAVIETLDAKEVPAGVFSLNPRNNPLFSVAGFAELGPDADYASLNMSVSNGDFLTVQVEPGLDGYLIVKDSLKVKVKNATDTIVPSQQIISKDGDKYKIIVYMQKDDGLKTSHKYSVVVEGYDEKGNAVTTAEDKGYGFYFKRSNVLPTLSVTVPDKEDAVIYNADSLEVKLSGTVNFPSSICDQGDVIIEDKQGQYKWKVGTFPKDSNEAWSINLKLKKDLTDSTYSATDSNGNTVTYKYLPDNDWTFYVYAECDDGSENAEKVTTDKIVRQFTVDTKKPDAPVLLNVNNTNYNAETWYTSQSISIDVDSKDIKRDSDIYASGVLKTQYKIGDGSWSDLNTTTSGFINGLKDGDNELHLRTIDSVGNSTDNSGQIILKVDTAPPEIVKALIGKETEDTSDWEEFTADSVLSISNGHGKKIKLELEENNTVDFVEVKVGGTVLPGTCSRVGTTKNWIWISDAEAVIAENENVAIDVKARDLAQGVRNAQYKVMIDTAGPEITVTSPAEDLSGEESISQSSYVLKASIVDAAGKVSVSKYKISTNEIANEAAIIADYKTNGTAENGWLSSINAGSVNVPVIIEDGNGRRGNITDATISEGQWYLYIYASDDAGNVSAAKRSFWTDRNAPTITVIEAPKSIYNMNNNAATDPIHFSGTVSDVNGVAKIEYSKDGGTSWVDISSVSHSTWELPVITYGAVTGDEHFEKGKRSLSLRATDNAGKTSVKTYGILIDMAPPLITSASIANAKTWYKSRTLQPQVKASDEESSVAKVEYSFTSGTNAEWNSLTNLNGNFTGGVTFPADGGDQTLYLKATDEAGNTCTSSIDINIDTAAPLVSKKYYKLQKEGKAVSSDFDNMLYVDGETAITVWGEYSDTVSGVEELAMNIGGSAITGSENITITYSTEVLPSSAADLESMTFAAYDAANEKTIKSWKAELTASAINTGSLGVSGADKAGNACSLQILNFTKDTENPQIANVSVTDNSGITSAYLASAEDAQTLVYYVNNSSSKTFAIRGVATDNNRIASTELKIGSKTYPISGTAGNWTFTIDDLNTYSGTSATVTITTKDLAERSASKEITINFDNAGPVFAHGLDFNGKDVNFRIGDDAGIGGKYKAGTWSNTNSIVVRGTADDNSGSGLSKVYYKVFTSESDLSEISFSRNDKFIEASTMSAKTVEYTKANGDKGTVSVTSNFMGEIKGLTDGSNYIVLLAEDKVGNTALDLMIPAPAENGVVDQTDENWQTGTDWTTIKNKWNKGKQYYSLNVDTVPPEIKSTTEGTKFSNGSTPVTVSGTCKDTGSKIESVTVSVKIGTGDNATKSVTVETSDMVAVDENSWKWTATIPADKISAVEDGKTYNIEAKAKDVAGLTSSLTVAILQGDKKAPTASLISIHSDKASVERNGNYYIRPSKDLVTVKGNTDDTYSTTVETYLKLIPFTGTIPGETVESDSEKFIYRYAKDADGNNIATKDRTWTLTIPADTLPAEYSGAYLYACTKDLAGNTSALDEGDILITKLIADEDAPHNNNDITVGGNSNQGWQKSTNLSVKGTWNDAAGVDKIYYKVTQDDTTAPAFDKDTWQTLSGTEDSNGKYTFENAIDSFLNGNNYLYLYAIDKLANAITELYKLSVKVDTEIPSVADGYEKDGKTYRFNDIYLVNGLDAKTFYFYIEDTYSGIKGTLNESTNVFNPTATIKLDKTTLDETNSTITLTDLSDSDTKKLVTLTIDESVLSGNGYRPVKVTLEDNAGNKTDTTIGTINIDEINPVVKLNVPDDADTDTTSIIEVNGIITITGTATDANIEDEPVSEIQYYTSANGWKPVSELGNNIFTITKNDEDFEFTIDTTKLEEKEYKLRVLAKDQADRTGISNEIAFTVDQDTDRPVIKFTNITIPAEAVSEGTKASLTLSTSILKGTVKDDDELAADGFVIILNGKSEVIPVINGTWTKSLNDKTYEVIFQVTDSKGNTFTSGTIPKPANAPATAPSTLQKTPKITDGTNTLGEKGHESSVTEFTLRVDTKLPLTQNLEFALPAVEPTWSSALPKLGGTLSNGLLLRFEAGDENGITSVTAELGDDTYTAALKNKTPGSESTEWETTIQDREVICTLCEFSEIDVSGLTTDGNYSLEFTIIDGAGNEKLETVTLPIDRTGPALDITSPTTNKLESVDVWAYGTISDAKASCLYYAISSDGVHAPDGNTTLSSWDEYNVSTKTKTSHSFVSSYKPAYTTEGMDFGINWNIYFDNNTSTATEVHDKGLREYLIEMGITTEEALNEKVNLENQFDKLVQLYLWLKAEDEVGNITEKAFSIIFDPQGDRPEVNFTYPSKEGDILGGKVTVYGTAEDNAGTNIGVRDVWVQILSKTHWDAGHNTATTGNNFGESENSVTSFELTTNDLDYLVDNGYEVWNMKEYSGAETNTDWKWAKGQTVPSGYSVNDYAILARLSGIAWLLDINNAKEFNPQGLNTNSIAIRVFARDKDGKFSAKYDKLVKFDASRPVISNLKLVEKNEDDTVELSSQTYESGIVVKGNWFLTGTVEDDDKIGKLEIDGQTIVEDGDDKTVNFSYKLGTASGVGSKEFTIYVEDKATGTPNDTEETVSIKFDNEAPVLVKTKEAGREISPLVQQDNGFYKLRSKAKEPDVAGVSQSGFAYTAFYFKREYGPEGSKTTKLYNALQERSAATHNISGKEIPALGEESASDTIVLADKLYWYVKSLKENSDGTMTIKVNNTENILVNSLVRIGGATYFTTSMPSADGSVTLDRKVPAGYSKAYVAIAAIVDNANEDYKNGAKPQWPGNGYYAASDLYRDDGDYMLEDVAMDKQEDATWIWEANICSRNIPDGPIEIVYVVFDKAGNCATDSVTGFVGNNQPRIAGVRIKTDYTGNNEAETEIDTWSATKKSNNSVTGRIGSGADAKDVYDPYSKYNIDNKKFTVLSQEMTAGSATEPAATVRGLTQIIPEIIGGNGTVYYSYDDIKNSGVTKIGKKEKVLALYEEKETDSTLNYDFTINKSNPINIQLGDLLLIGDSATPIPFKFTFTDETEGLSTLSEEVKTKWETDLGAKFKAELTVYLAIDACQESIPEASIKPFYWESINKNSIYGSENAASYKDLRGHIELESDWANAPGYDESVAYLDADPKVSGEIVIEGTAFDKKSLASITINLNGTDVLVAEYSNGQLASKYPETSYEENNIAFVMDQTATTAGYSVNWKFYWNTQKAYVTDIAKEDFVVTVTANNYGVPVRDNLLDSNGPLVGIDGSTKYKKEIVKSQTPSVSSTVQTGSTKDDDDKVVYTPYYRLDIVPYVTDIQTSLSSANTGNHSVYSRTALGHYPVYMTHAQGNGVYKRESNIKVYGFNLANGILSFENGDNDSNSVNLTDATDHYTIQIPEGARSGKAKVTVKGICSLNNLNNDDANGTSKQTTDSITGDANVYGKYYYNRQPNDENNNRLTDDLNFDVWDFNSQAAVSQNNSCLDIIMKINPNNGLVGFAFCDGALNWSMADTTSSYANWANSKDFIQLTGFSYDSYGNTYGTAAGGESSGEEKADAFDFYTSRWGTSGITAKSSNNLRMECTAQKTDSSGASVFTLDKKRFHNPSFASHKVGGDKHAVDLYLAYYDATNGEIRFRTGTINDDIKGSKPFGAFFDSYTDTKDDGSQPKNYSHNINYFQILANGNGSNLGTAGEYLSLGVTSDNVVVIVWYDGTALKLSYNDNPLPTKEDGTLDLPTGTSRGNWSNAETISSGASKYCQLVVDGADNIHVAAYDNANGDLKYIYIPKATSGKHVPNVNDKKECIVDSYLSVGQELTIDVAGETVTEGETTKTYYIPHIGYFGTTPKKPRYAYLAEPATFFTATNKNERSGTIDDMYTGIWECGVVPSDSTITIDEKRRINVGVWKKSDGTRRNSYYTSNGPDTDGENKNGSSTATSKAGTCYGNGTSNAVLAYGVQFSKMRDYVETAQKR